MSQGPLGALDQLTRIMWEWGRKTPLGSLAESAGENVAGSLGRMKEAATAPAEESQGPVGAIPNLVAGLQRWQSRGRGAPVSGLPIDRPPTREEDLAHSASVEGNATPLNKLLYSMQLGGSAPAEGAGSVGSMFLGPLARRMPIDRISKAQELSQRGYSPERVYKETSGMQGALPGISYGLEGLPRWEISDIPAKVDFTKFSSPGAFKHQQAYTGKLSDVFTHHELVDNYPKILDREAEILVDPDLAIKNVGGSLDPRTGKMVVRARNENEVKHVITHELQHGVQLEEGFAQGGDLMAMEKVVRKQLLHPVTNRRDRLMKAFSERLKDKGLVPPGLDVRASDLQPLVNTPTFRNLHGQAMQIREIMENPDEIYRLYERLAGEVEARNAARRMDLTNRERAGMTPQSTEDVQRKNQRFRSKEDLLR